MCLKPKLIIRDGKYTVKNFRGDRGEEYHIMAFTHCGHCSECIAQKANNWVVRNYYESKAYNEMSFITLTYAKSPFFLIRKHLQDFMKRFRRYLEYHEKIKIRAFYAGEYGTIRKRPHFHIIVYGWSTKDLIYKGLSKKGYPIFESEIIKKLWGKGITTYQHFKDKEIAYIALYNTPNETESKGYILEILKAKELLEKLKKEKCLEYRHEIIKELNNAIKIAEERKEKYINIKEFNGWSKALGWEEFYKEFSKNKTNYAFKEYIKDAEFPTPTPWVKKLANMNNYSAIAEMRLREQALTTQLETETISEIKNKKLLSKWKKHIFEIEEWQTTKKGETDL